MTKLEYNEKGKSIIEVIDEEMKKNKIVEVISCSYPSHRWVR